MLWIKAFHLIFMVAWFSGLFYLPRLFVYHTMADDAVGRERFKIMERKLYSYIMNPAMFMTIGLGLWLYLLSPAFYQTQGWMHAKLALVLMLIGFHHVCGAYVKKFEKDMNTRDITFYRIFNEVPTLFLIGIIVLVVVKPF